MVTTANLVIEPVQPADAAALADFFRVLAADPQTVCFFHPHPLTASTAFELANRRGLDRYYLARYGGRVVGYSLLRGWEEGYTIPSFGGCTHPRLRGAGLGHALLEHAIAASRAAGARQLRLTVYRANTAAVHLYRKFGFVLTLRNEQEWLGLLNLERATLPAGRLNTTVLDTISYP